MVIHLLGVTGAEVVVVVLPCTFATSSTLKSDPTSLIQILNSCVLKSKNPEPSHFLFQTGIDLRILPIELFDKFEVLLAKIEAENVESNILGDINCDMMAVTPAPAND